MSKKNKVIDISDLFDRPMSNLGKYKVLETKVLKLPYGNIQVIANDTIICPNHLPIKKQLIESIHKCFKPFTNTTDLNNKTLLIERYGGIGDLISIIPSIYELKLKFPHSNIILMCSPNYMPIFYFFSDLINGTVNNIIQWNVLKKVDYFITLENYLESTPSKKTIQEIFGEGLYQNISQESMHGSFSFNKAINNKKSYKRQGIGIQYETNSLLRNYNIDNMIDVINNILEKNQNEFIYLLGKPDDYLNINYIQSKTDGRVIPNGCGREKMNLQQIFELISSLKLVIGPDSSMIHIAGINNTPLIGLFGPFKSETRISNYYNSIGIDGIMNCSPCNRHNPVSWCKWNGGLGKCLNSISPQMISEQALSILDKYNEN